MNILRSKSLIGASAVALMLAAAPAMAEMVDYTAELASPDGVDSSGTGSVEASFDTDSMELTWTITYADLTGEATAAHFHGPASEGENAPPVVPIEGDLTSPIEGTATLSEEQATQLADGMWYLNIHTAEYPDGEIRGQVMPGM
jgi:hypothetical protein